MSDEVGYRRIHVSCGLIEEILRNGTCCVRTANVPKDITVISSELSLDGRAVSLLVASHEFAATTEGEPFDVLVPELETIECARLQNAAAVAPESESL